jgi:Ca2+-binding EF-hand superfamily protein
MGPNTPATKLSQYMQLAQSATTISDAVLTIDPTGASNFLATNTSLKTITFTNGWSAGGLNDTLSNLVSKKVINLNYLSATPLMLDLNGDGVHTTSVDEGVIFDIQGNGQPVTTAWSDGKDGFLALDVNHDGVINSGLELFGNGTVLPNGTKAQDGFEALSIYDGNQDGVIDASDDIFANLRVWIDTNHNGISEHTELLTLDNLGVKNIQLHATASQSVDHGNALNLVSQWTDTAGYTHALADVIFATTTQLKHNAVI